jgi:hypothetical protein
MKDGVLIDRNPATQSEGMCLVQPVLSAILHLDVLAYDISSTAERSSAIAAIRVTEDLSTLQGIGDCWTTNIWGVMKISCILRSIVWWVGVGLSVNSNRFAGWTLKNARYIEHL